ncbi:MAG: TVP38/TMEM64 family protein [Spirochaetaceae bacterium]
MASKKTQSTVKAVIAVAAIAALIILGRVFDVPFYLRAAMEWIRDLGFPGVFVFIALYTTTTVLLIPGTIPSLAAGAIFGVVQGSIYVSLGATLGATAAFFIGRYLARDWVASSLKSRPKFAAIDEAIGREGWKIVGLLRLSPVVPFSMSNYFYGITNVKPLGYILASWIGMMPGVVMYVYIGSLLGMAAAGGGEMTTGQWVMMVVGLAATVAVTVMITRIAKKAISEKVGTDAGDAPVEAIQAGMAGSVEQATERV